MILVYFSLSVFLGIFFVYLIIKLVDQWKLKQLKKKYPEGTVTKSIKVGSFDEIPTALAPAVNKELLDKLKQD